MRTAWFIIPFLVFFHAVRIGGETRDMPIDLQYWLMAGTALLAFGWRAWRRPTPVEGRA